MKLTEGEKLILVALAELSGSKGSRELNLDLIKKAIVDGQTWAIDWEMSFYKEENDTPAEIAEETGQILTACSFVEASFKRLDAAEKERVEKEVYPYDIEFQGFDGNHDPHMGAARFMIEDLGRFGEFKERNLNSHTSTSLPHYRKMVRAFRARKGNGLLTADEIISIVKA